MLVHLKYNGVCVKAGWVGKRLKTVFCLSLCFIWFFLIFILCFFNIITPPFVKVFSNIKF
ncbi:hypothetical protein DBR76_20405 [Salmonella enterica]|nr:hypothetical protein [Salmonella enterica]